MAFGGELDRGPDEVGPRPGAELAMGGLEALHLPGHGGGLPADHAVLGEIAFRVEKNFARAAAGRLLSEIEEVSAAVGHSDQDVAAAAEAGHPRVGDAEHES